MNGTTIPTGRDSTYSPDEVSRPIISPDEGGGGGSSDFSTAKVTFINSADSTTKYLVVFPECVDLGDNSALSLSQREIAGGTPVNVKIPLYKGMMALDAMQYLINIDQSVMPTFSGDVSLSDGYILISGDGSITCAGTTQS